MKYEYTFYLTTNALDCLHKLDQHGADGWELAAVSSQSNATIFWFKRPKKDV